ncbi:extra-large guanine nucleotide-binding protein 1-like [Olea europaea var. sylvestris]|uniref:Extra-large guanine nucleotide-binding 1-like n=1 Tax=Olea europaea subsp. europaea TaxID=158383 RepID=A0A8S0PJU0_OLEEU|nr:extra-large guanine nucleotide-binding protein 1-like [Olea europaea var. sylvestris]CAA2954320.1 extra-large guanine nucleotide-binding 1-like [Olea europaea subsp. europaea]
MTSVLRSFLPGSTSTSRNNDCDEDYSVEYSFAMEYSGPPVNHDIPQVLPIDVRRIPTAAAAKVLNNLSLPIIQPIVKSKPSEKKFSIKSPDSVIQLGKARSSEEILSRKLEIADENSSSSGTLGFSEGLGDSNQLSGSSDVEDIDDKCKAIVDHDYSKSTVDSSEISSSEEVELRACENEIEAEAPGLHIMPPVVDFHELTQSDVNSDGSDPEPQIVFPERPVVSGDAKGLCHRCHRKSRFADKEVCIVCRAKYCSKCVIRAMGSMPEGRKCITCIGYRIDESRRGSLGKTSRLLKKILVDEAIKHIMKSELSCEVNQLPPHLVCVNEKPLTIEELVSLQSCPNPPKKLRPGRFWYDKVSGFWGKVGEKPSQIITSQLTVGLQIRKEASNGNTNVLINSREITKPELRMLKVAGIHCEGNPHFWVTADGSYQLEGMNYVMGKLWDKTRVKIVCKVLSLPFPSDVSNPGGEDVANKTDEVNLKILDRKRIAKFLLVGGDRSGTSTIFKQAKILYDVPFSEDERENIKFVIQRNLYSYIGIILEGREQFEEDYSVEMRRQRHIDQPGPSEISEEVDEQNIYSISPSLKAFSDWLLQVMGSGNLEAVFPAATREYAPLIEQLWKNEAFQASYKRRNELHKLPRVSNYFLDRAVEISKINYEPSEMDILYAEGITSSNGVASMEFSFPVLSQDAYMESNDQSDPILRYQLIRVNENSLGGNCKWLEMFEDVNLVMFCVSLTDFDELHEDATGICTNKMLANKKLFERVATHPSFAQKNFILILNKFDLLEEKIEQVPLSLCEWFQDFSPLISLNPHNTTNPPLAQRAFHYIAVKFKRLFNSLTGRKLFVAPVTGLEADSVDLAFKYGREVLKWDMEKLTFSMNEDSIESIEASTT